MIVVALIYSCRKQRQDNPFGPRHTTTSIGMIPGKKPSHIEERKNGLSFDATDIHSRKIFLVEETGGKVPPRKIKYKFNQAFPERVIVSFFFFLGL